MGKLDYSDRFYIKIVAIWMIYIITGSALLEGRRDLFFSFIQSIWFFLFCLQSAAVRFLIAKRPFNFSSLSIVVFGGIGLFVLIYSTSTVAILWGSPIMALLALVVSSTKDNAVIDQCANIMFFLMTPLLLHLHTSILRYHEEADNTEDAKLIRTLKETCFVGLFANGRAYLVLNGTLKEAFSFTIYLWLCWFLLMLVSSALMRFFAKNSAMDAKNNALLFLASYTIASIPFASSNYIPSAIVLLKSLASLVLSDGYYSIFDALRIICYFVLLLFFLYRAHLGILGYKGERDYCRNKKVADQKTHGAGNEGSGTGFEREKEKID